MGMLLHFDEAVRPYSKAKRFAYTAEIKSGNKERVRKIFSGFDQSLQLFFVKAHIQNHAVYIWGEKLFVYFEYTGSNFDRDDKKLNSNPKVVKFNTELDRNLKIKWEVMKEVFHTD